MGDPSLFFLARLISSLSLPDRSPSAPACNSPTPLAALPPTPLRTLSPEDTSVEEFVVEVFDQVHSPVDGDTSMYLIFVNLPVSKPAANMPPDVAAFLGRWEGYIYAPPVEKDRKMVLVIQEINARERKDVGWAKLSTSDSNIGPIEFSRDRFFYICKDYARYLAGKGITSQVYQDSELIQYGQG